VAATRAEIGPDVTLKAILESGELGRDALVERAGRAALAGGADFLKTSTGKTAVSATRAAARVLLSVLVDPAAAASGGREPVGLKVSGGVRTVEDAAIYLDLADAALGVDAVGPSTLRFGASGLLDALLAVLPDDVSR
jgi:deoxyribose-phosphate aldolase